ncbi:phosphotransferase family protein [Streptomyces himalayensis]|uniref:Aminoglycoside phosphotransferase family protein n=1 Tax=Streptomyces himalayensis subsp. himalayensis TaxID=2756131 RepID=A0A7W0DQV1_9ACTN|nr:aminoglycoside phosphotransferase family protein [Streptomyces himalayensis]MBA2949582.1 aminoglycoside phosphotransferase family protein [Streptomyces himalayensis subsp. himalayensis]
MAPVVARACRGLLDAEAVSSRRLAAGSRSVVYRVRLADGHRVVVKVYAATARRNALTEARVSTAAADFVAVPPVLAVGLVPSLGSTALITRDLGTVTLEQAVAEGRFPYRYALRRAVALLKGFHRIPAWSLPVPPRPFADHVASLARRCGSSTLLHIEPALECIASRISVRRPVWCHGDVHFGNIVISADGADHLVDFPHIWHGPPEFDLAQTLTMTNALAPDDLHAIKRHYGTPVDTGLVAALVVFHTLRCWVHSTPHPRDQQLWAARFRALAARHPELFRNPTRLTAGRTIR